MAKALDGTFSLRYRRKETHVFKPVQEEIFRIMSLPFFNRYSDKTQVYFLMENDDITHRSHHVSKVSLLSRMMASALGLNGDLCESISLAHDLGHPPFAHSGERFLDRILFSKAGLHFSHAVQSVRVVERIFPIGLSLETLCGIICHSGFLFDVDDGAVSNPSFDWSLGSFDEFDMFVQVCLEKGSSLIKTAIAPSQEARAVRLCDVISYVYRDREDALLVGYDFSFKGNDRGLKGEMALLKDAISQSSRRGCICMSPAGAKRLLALKRENSDLIYSSSDFDNIENTCLYPLFESLFMRFLDDLRKRDRSSLIFKHHIDYVERFRERNLKNSGFGSYFEGDEERNPFLIVTDFISSMSDDYFLSLCRLYFPNITKKLSFAGYFEGFNPNKRRKSSAKTAPSLFDEQP